MESAAVRANKQSRRCEFLEKERSPRNSRHWSAEDFKLNDNQSSILLPQLASEFRLVGIRLRAGDYYNDHLTLAFHGPLSIFHFLLACTICDYFSRFTIGFMDTVQNSRIYHFYRLLAVSAIFMHISAANAGAVDPLWQDQLVPESELSLRSGIESQEVLDRFGEPDRRVASPGEGRESWYFGNSIIFMSDQKVTAWTDAGDLIEHQTYKSLAPEEHAKDFKLQGWTTAWEQNSSVSEEQIIDEIVK